MIEEKEEIEFIVDLETPGASTSPNRNELGISEKKEAVSFSLEISLFDKLKKHANAKGYKHTGFSGLVIEQGIDLILGEKR